MRCKRVLDVRIALPGKGINRLGRSVSPDHGLVDRAIT